MTRNTLVSILLVLAFPVLGASVSHVSIQPSIHNAGATASVLTSSNAVVSLHYGTTNGVTNAVGWPSIASVSLGCWTNVTVTLSATNLISNSTNWLNWSVIEDVSTNWATAVQFMTLIEPTAPTTHLYRAVMVDAAGVLLPDFDNFFQTNPPPGGIGTISNIIINVVTSTVVDGVATITLVASNVGATALGHQHGMSDSTNVLWPSNTAMLAAIGGSTQDHTHATYAGTGLTVRINTFTQDFDGNLEFDLPDVGMTNMVFTNAPVGASTFDGRLLALGTDTVSQALTSLMLTNLKLEESFVLDSSTLVLGTNAFTNIVLYTVVTNIYTNVTVDGVGAVEYTNAAMEFSVVSNTFLLLGTNNFLLTLTNATVGDSYYGDHVLVLGTNASSGTSGSTGPYTASSNILNNVVDYTNVLTAGMGSSLYMAMTQSVVFTTDGSYSSNGVSEFELNLLTGTNVPTFSYPTFTNAFVLSTSYWNRLVFTKPYMNDSFWGTSIMKYAPCDTNAVAAIPPDWSNSIVWLRFDNGTTTNTIMDSSARAVNRFYLSQSSPDATEYGFANAAFKPDANIAGSTNYAWLSSSNHTLLNGMTEYTFAAWVNPDDYQLPAFVDVGLINVKSSSFNGMATVSSNRFSLWAANNQGGPGTNYASTTTGTWHRMVGTREGTLAVNFYDGVMVYSNPSFTATAFDGTGQLSIGGRGVDLTGVNSNLQYHGWIDDVYITSNRWTSEEAAQDFANGRSQ